MEIRHVEAFLAVAEHKGFRRAAAKTYLSQPALSAAVRELERRLGVVLLVRRSDGTELTAAGEALLEPARRLVDDLEQTRRAARHLGYRGEVALGIMPGGAAELTRPLVGGLQRSFPGVTFRLRGLTLMDWHDRLLDQVDLLVGSPPWPRTAHRATVLLDEPIIVAYPTAMLPDRPDRLSLDEALRLPMISFAEPTPRPVVDFWNLSWLSGAAADYRACGPDVAGPAEARDAIVAGQCAAFGPARVSRVVPSQAFSVAAVDGEPAAGVRLMSRLTGSELVDAIHDEAAHIVRMARPWVLSDPAQSSVLASLGL
jgi:DNA-binding transcriptional LysR family regulator